MTELLLLPQDEAHLWYVRSSEVSDASLLATYHALLTPEEEARRARYVFERNRHEYLLTRALCRGVLSRYADVAPSAWRFSENQYGRPEIALPAGCPIRFNLTNTDGLIACLVAHDREIGVDVEDVERRGETVTIADRFFSPSEVAALRAIPVARQRARFFDYWTLKEAYIKARGMGLSIPLDQFSYIIERGAPIRISFDPRLPDDPATWQFAQFRPTARHLVSAAVRRSGEPDLRFVVRRIIPLLPAADVIEDGIMI
jgi:4'-phosphopantetheinyl transferase